MSNTMMNPVPNPQEPARTGGLNGRVVLHAVRRRPLVFAGVFLLAAAAGAVVWFFLPLPKMTAAVSFHVASQRPAILGNASAETGAPFTSYKVSQATYLKSRLTISNALKEDGIQTLSVFKKADPDPATWLERNLKVDSAGNSEFIRVTLEGDEGEELAKVLGAIARVYLAGVKDQDNGPQIKRLEALEKNEKDYRKKLEEHQATIDSIAITLGAVDGPTLAVLDSVRNAELTRADDERQKTQQEYEIAEKRLKDYEQGTNAASLPTAQATSLMVGAVFTPVPAAVFAQIADSAASNPVPDYLIDQALRNDPTMQSYEAEVEKLKQALKQAEADFDKGSPALAGLRDKLQTAQTRRDSYRDSRRESVEAQIRENERLARISHRVQLQTAVAEAAARLQYASNHVSQTENKIKERSKYRLDLEKYKRLIQRYDSLSNQIAHDIEMLKVESEAPQRVTMVDPPYVMTGIEGNRRLKYTLMVALGVLVLGFGGLVMWESYSRPVTSTEEVTTAIGVPLLGTVPPILPPGSPQTAINRAALVEAIDTTRTMLLHGTAGGRPLQTVMVTSAVAGEGKTSLSGHLAISLARAGYRTLLIDGDLQSPAAHGLFELSSSPGLSELLRGEVPTTTAVRSTPIPGLAVIPAGVVDLAARQALVGDRWRQIRKELESQYDFIVIDTAPLLMMSDTLLFAREADGIVLSVLLGVSRVNHVAETAARLRSIGAHVAGAVVNGVWHDAYRSSYRYASKDNVRPRLAEPLPIAEEFPAPEAADPIEPSADNNTGAGA